VVANYEEDILSVFDAYNARATRTASSYFSSQDFTDAKGKVEFCIGGHIHVDHDFSSDGGIPIIITTADANQNRVPDSMVDSGTTGTTTEAAVFGIIADYNNADNIKITVVGVGRGTSRVVRKGGIKPVSISNISYSGDTTVGATIDKSKFAFTVTYGDSTTDTITGATSVSPATIGVVGNNTIEITYTEGTATVSGTMTIVGTEKPIVNLIDFTSLTERVTGTAGNYMAGTPVENAFYMNISNVGKFSSSSSSITVNSADSITVKESGAGGVCVAMAIDRDKFNGKSTMLSFNYAGEGKARVYWRYYSDTANTFTGGSPTIVIDEATAGGSGECTTTIPYSESGGWLFIFFSANTGKTKTYSNVSLTLTE
jgi:hypothetical protein